MVCSGVSGMESLAGHSKLCMGSIWLINETTHKPTFFWYNANSIKKTDITFILFGSSESIKTGEAVCKVKGYYSNSDKPNRDARECYSDKLHIYEQHWIIRPDRMTNLRRWTYLTYSSFLEKKRCTFIFHLGKLVNIFSVKFHQSRKELISNW